MRRPVTDIALLAFIAKKKADVISYTEATQACKSSSSASRALHQLIQEGMIEPQPKLIGLRYVTQYAVTPKGKQVSQLALHLTELRSSTKKPVEEKTARAHKQDKKAQIKSPPRKKVAVQGNPMNSKPRKSKGEESRSREDAKERNDGEGSQEFAETKSAA